MEKCYRITWRTEIFFTAPNAEAAKDLFQAADLTEHDTEFVEVVSVERYDEPFGTPIEDDDLSGPSL